MRKPGKMIFDSAVQHYWATLHAQKEGQKKRGAVDLGYRTQATGGKQMSGFAAVVTRRLVEAGLAHDDIFCDSRVELPGYYRPTKKWDLIVVRDGRLLAALEFKSMASSYGNNLNNRVEEAVGTACDTWTAFREGALHPSSQPWLGYLFFLAERTHSDETKQKNDPHKVVSCNEPHFATMSDFRDASYAKRCELLCRRLVLERQYTSSCFLFGAEPEPGGTASYAEPAADLSAAQWIVSLTSHIRASLEIEKALRRRK